MTPTDIALPDLLPTVRALSRTDKLRLIEMLARELAQEEIPYLVPGATYEVWTPIDAFEAAAVMLRELEKAKAAPRSHGPNGIRLW